MIRQVVGGIPADCRQAVFRQSGLSRGIRIRHIEMLPRCNAIEAGIGTGHRVGIRSAVRVVHGRRNFVGWRARQHFRKWRCRRTADNCWQSQSIRCRSGGCRSKAMFGAQRLQPRQGDLSGRSPRSQIIRWRRGDRCSHTRGEGRCFLAVRGVRTERLQLGLPQKECLLHLRPAGFRTALLQPFQRRCGFFRTGHMRPPQGTTHDRGQCPIKMSPPEHAPSCSWALPE